MIWVIGLWGMAQCKTCLQAPDAIPSTEREKEKKNSD
jgi:hypothetical protein